jgi:UDP-N-acetylglucosamine pyrophosphorylase
MDNFELFEKKMTAAGLGPNVIAAFRRNYELLAREETGMIAESDIEPVTELPRAEDLTSSDKLSATEKDGLLRETVVLKLNGGLGTSMGLEKAKSLLPVRGKHTFLDLITRQILHLRETLGSVEESRPAFVLMNSFSTSEDTREALKNYPNIREPELIELLQNRIPKVDAESLRPAEWPHNPELEWCPPGHGDIYTALWSTGKLRELLDAGIRTMFVANADNLGATLDLAILRHFTEKNYPFMMEVCRRTSSDRKGGHLAFDPATGRYLLRESAQTAEEDAEAFQDIDKHKFFNTNNLWLRLDVLYQALEEHGGWLPLPLITNKKTVDPRDKTSPAVYQLETAMGAAIASFNNSGTLVVPRARFAPVKTTSDLLAVRSDAYELTEDYRLRPAQKRRGQPPAISLDPEHYKLVDQLDAATPDGPPSLVDCDALRVWGPWIFPAEAKIVGQVSFQCPDTDAPKHAEAREYRDEEAR